MTVRPSIFITGAASGIGRASARLFARNGWTVGLFDIDRSGLSDLARTIGDTNVCLASMDVRRPAQISDAVRMFADQTGGRMDVLFNSAGILPMGGFDRIELEMHLKTVEVNLCGVINCVYAALPCLKKTPGAHIITMGSASAIYGTPDLAVYSATKCAVKGLTEALNIEFEKFGIQVCDIMVAYVDTPLLRKEHVAASVSKLGVHVQPERVAGDVWKAAHGNRVHWTIRLKPLLFLNWLFPFARAAVMKRLA